MFCVHHSYRSENVLVVQGIAEIFFVSEQEKRKACIQDFT